LERTPIEAVEKLPLEIVEDIAPAVSEKVMARTLQMMIQPKMILR
jgi:hypothetical protein